MTQPSKFHQAVEHILLDKLAPYKGVVPTRTVCLEIYNVIFETFVELLEKIPNKITNESMNYLAQSYYDAVTINVNDELDPNIFDKRASVKEIKTEELAFMAMLVNGTDFCPPILFEIKRRS